MLPHIAPREERMDVTIKRRQHGHRQALDLVLAAVLVGHLAWHVLREFGFSATRIEALVGQLQTAEEPSR